MTKESSIYLDLIRFLAAFIVMLSHFSFQRFTGDSIILLHQFGQVGVIIFFVMSGYVINFVAHTKENDIKTYFISRFSRLYSVVLPVLLLIPIFDFIGQNINLVMYDNYFRNDLYVIRMLSNLVFLQQIWFYGIGYLSNGPLWSLGYEFWYYVLFGLSLFISGYKKYFFIFIVALIIGPKILLLLPVWLFGVWIYNFHKNKELNQTISRILFLVSPFLFLYCFNFYNEINEYVYSILGNDIKSKLGFSAGFITDYITAFFIGIHILSMKYININILNKTLWGGEKVIKFFANSSFSLYLFHFPLLLFFGAILNHNPNSGIDIFILFSLTFTSCILLAQFTEKKKYVYKKYITFFWEKLEKGTKK